MPIRHDPLCPQCQRSRRGSRLGRLGWLGARELLVGAAALGLVVGLGWAGEARICEALGDQLASPRDAALDRYVEARCDERQCESIEVVSASGCRAKVRVIERRFDEYGDEIGAFRVDEGLEFSPLLERWRMRAEIDAKQVLGLPAH